MLSEKTNGINNCVFLNPENFIYGDVERNRFRAYQESLSRETDIDSVWRWYTNDYFPFDIDAYIDVMEKFLPDHVELFAKHCNVLKAPVILCEIFAIKRKEKDFIFEFLSKAPVCIKTNDKGEPFWDCQSYAAPLMLDSAYNTLLAEYPLSKELNEDVATEFSMNIGNALLKREDGYFLIWNYVKFLLSKNEKNQAVLSVFLDAIGDVCRPIVKDHYEHIGRGNDWRKALRPSINLKDNAKHFVQTGLLGKPVKESMYLNLLAQMQFYPKEKLDDYIPPFEDSLKIEDDKFPAFEPAPHLCHYYIADIYLSADNPVDKWLETWKSMQPALYRVCFNRYDDVSSFIERNLNFLLLIGVAIAERMYSDNGEKDEGNCSGLVLCDKVWNILNNIINLRGDKSSRLNREMVNYVAILLFMFIKRTNKKNTASDRIASTILSLTWSPREILSLLLMIENNNIELWRDISNHLAKELYEKTMWLANLAIEQKPCEYKLGALGEKIKKWAETGYASSCKNLEEINR